MIDYLQKILVLAVAITYVQAAKSKVIRKSFYITAYVNCLCIIIYNMYCIFGS